MGTDAAIRSARHPAPRATARTLWRRVAAGGLAVTVLLAVFLAYLQPTMALQLAQQLWSCF